MTNRQRTKAGTFARHTKPTHKSQPCKRACLVPTLRGHTLLRWTQNATLVAFACKLSFQRGHEGNVSFFSKTRLVQHYIDSLGAMHVGGRIMIIDTIAALKLIDKYFAK